MTTHDVEGLEAKYRAMGYERLVYFVFYDNEDQTYDWGLEFLDGDLDQVKPLDMSDDGGIRVYEGAYNQGRRIDGTHIPTRAVVVGRKDPLKDVVWSRGSFLVNETIKSILEELEPDVHQFFPIQIEWKDGSEAGLRYWFNPCNRLDAPDEERSTWILDKIWDPNGQENYLVFDYSKIGSAHFWYEKLMSGFKPLFISDVLKEKLDAAGVTGFGFDPNPAFAPQYVDDLDEAK